MLFNLMDAVEAFSFHSASLSTGTGVCRSLHSANLINVKVRDELVLAIFSKKVCPTVSNPLLMWSKIKECEKSLVHHVVCVLNW